MSLGLAEQYFDSLNAKSYLAKAESRSISDLSDWPTRERVLKRAKQGKQVNGITLPWSKTHDKVRLRPGELSIWAGYDGHNKSTLLCQIAVHAAQTCRVGIASFEVDLEDTVILMSQLSAGTPEPASRYINDFVSWAENRIYIYDRLDVVPTDVVTAGVQYMGDRLGCGLIIIDSFMMCGADGDGEQEKSFIRTLAGLAKSMNTHIAVAHHMRKPDGGMGESKIPGKFDLRGTSVLSGVASSIFICWADKELKKIKAKRDAGISLSPKETEKLSQDPDQLLIVAKQRNAPFEGGFQLWQNSSRQFTATSKSQPMLIEIPRM
jgi:twinkle protein